MDRHRGPLPITAPCYEAPRVHWSCRFRRESVGRAHHGHRSVYPLSGRGPRVPRRAAAAAGGPGVG
ncbi:hypothetical protein D187_008860 [Cystobacter fuscus DSM 2262]|uniref:Uncharacterized protein n=1 Tax=Cystobacter fuscus (strain ATCC 25194 / DSM 2262 / NBRC 100088 / M29) TaxID=1242864 RepID=S9PJS6_CYSF2|nr:hypothetical protein D187_008860 [Cystobacter fuscus DSM 2262]